MFQIYIRECQMALVKYFISIYNVTSFNKNKTSLEIIYVSVSTFQIGGLSQANTASEKRQYDGAKDFSQLHVPPFPVAFPLLLDCCATQVFGSNPLGQLPATN